MRQAERRADGVIQFAWPVYSRAQQTSRVQNDPDCLAALYLIYFRDQMSAARRSRPADFAILITRAEFAQTFKFAATVFLFAVAFKVLHAAFLPLMLGFMAALAAYWVGYIRSGIGQER